MVRKLYTIYDEITHKEYKDLLIDDVLEITGLTRNTIYVAVRNQTLLSNRYRVDSYSKKDKLLAEWDRVCNIYKRTFRGEQ